MLERKAKLAGLPWCLLVMGSVPSWGTKILQAAQCGQKKRKKTKRKNKTSNSSCVCVCMPVCV